LILFSFIIIKYRFALVAMGTANYLPDDDTAGFDISNAGGTPWLGIDHANKKINKNPSRYSNMEKPIKIFN
jgi:hypothetical protein